KMLVYATITEKDSRPLSLAALSLAPSSLWRRRCSCFRAWRHDLSRTRGFTCHPMSFAYTRCILRPLTAAGCRSHSSVGVLCLPNLAEVLRIDRARLGRLIVNGRPDVREVKLNRVRANSKHPDFDPTT